MNLNAAQLDCIYSYKGDEGYNIIKVYRRLTIHTSNEHIHDDIGLKPRNKKICHLICS